MAHAKLSPSSAYRWSVCTASPAEEAGKPDSSSAAARWGTAAHLVSSTCLERDDEPAAYLGKFVWFPANRGAEQIVDAQPVLAAGEAIERISDEMVECCEAYVGLVREKVRLGGGMLCVEQRVPISHITGEVDAGGTSDAVILTADELEIVDLKGGMGRVDAFSVVGSDVITGAPRIEPNLQLAMYAHGALQQFALFGPFKTVRMTIVQPRLRHVSEHVMTVAELDAFIARLSAAAEETRTAPVHRPSAETCHFCKASGNCAAQNTFVMKTCAEGFSDLRQPIVMRQVPSFERGMVYEALPLIESWCKTQRMRVREDLLEGRPVVGNLGPYKLVAGSQGDRVWRDGPAVEAALRAVGVEPHKPAALISPAQAETAIKKLKKVKPEAALAWDAMQELVDRAPDAAPVIVPASNPKPELQSAADGFASINKPAAAVPAEFSPSLFS